MTRTPQRAMKDAIDSGVVQAWIEGKPIQYNTIGTERWNCWTSGSPPFTIPDVSWRIKPIPQKPTIADWRPISEIPMDGKRYLIRSYSGFVGVIESYPNSKFPTNSFGQTFYESFAPIPE